MQENVSLAAKRVDRYPDQDALPMRRLPTSLADA